MTLILNRNMIFGIVNIVIGGIFLAASGTMVIGASAFSNEIYQEYCDSSGCRPLADIALEVATGAGIIGGIVTSIGLFLFLLGRKQSQPKTPETAV